LISTDSIAGLFQRVSKASTLSLQGFWILTVLMPALLWFFYYRQELAAVAATLVIGTLISLFFRHSAKISSTKSKTS
jgi:hypothetical protein